MAFKLAGANNPAMTEPAVYVTEGETVQRMNVGIHAGRKALQKMRQHPRFPPKTIGGKRFWPSVAAFLHLWNGLTLDAPGIQPSWANADYEPLRLAAPAHGLVWGGAWQWPDRPHVQEPGYVSGSDLSPLRAKWATTKGGTIEKLTAVWSAVDAAPIRL